MNNIPQALREEMAADPFYQRCCVTGTPITAGRKIEWHHNLISAGSQVQEKFAILPILKEIHDKEKSRTVKPVLDWIMLNRATDEELERYSKAINYKKRRDMLNKKFGGAWREGIKYFNVTPSGNIATHRTGQQNRALHLFYEHLATSLNDAGLDQRKVLKPEISIPWTKQAVKDALWRPIQQAMYLKRSTTDLLKNEEIERIHETLMRHLAEKFGIEYIPFPSYEAGYKETAPLKSEKPRYEGRE